MFWVYLFFKLDGENLSWVYFSEQEEQSLVQRLRSRCCVLWVGFNPIHICMFIFFQFVVDYRHIKKLNFIPPNHLPFLPIWTEETRTEQNRKPSDSLVVTTPLCKKDKEFWLPIQAARLEKAVARHNLLTLHSSFQCLQGKVAPVYLSSKESGYDSISQNL